METDNNKIQISGAVLNRNVSSDIKNQLKNIKGLSVSVEQITFKTSSITNAKKMLASKPVSLQVELDTFALKQQAQEIGREVGSQIREGIHDAPQKGNAFTFLSQWINLSSLLASGVTRVKQAVADLREIDRILEAIGKTSGLTASQLKQLENTAFETASKYGKKASDYLSVIQEMYRSGYKNAEQLAELSLLAQRAGGLDAELAKDYIIASDAAYRYGGNVEKLNALLDSQSQAAARNTVGMTELAKATQIAAGQFADASISENEMTALLGTGLAASKESGETVGRAVKGILMNLQQIQGEAGSDGELIDNESLTKAEKRCHAVGVELEYLKDGMVQLRNPLDILKELAGVYRSLPDGSAEKSGILSDIGGNYGGDVLSGILSNWDEYEKILSDSQNAAGAAFGNAMQSADKWEGSLNRLSNTWTDTVQNVADSHAIIAGIDSLNALLSMINKITDSLGALGTIGAAGGLLAAFKNVGSPKIAWTL